MEDIFTGRRPKQKKAGVANFTNKMNTEITDEAVEAKAREFYNNKLTIGAVPFENQLGLIKWHFLHCARQHLEQTQSLKDERDEALARVKELEQTIAAIQAGLKNEFSSIDCMSGDLIEDFECLMNHHKECERRLHILRLNGHQVITAYSEILLKYPLYKKFIKGTPLQNDCAAMAWDAVKSLYDNLSSQPKKGE